MKYLRSLISVVFLFSSLLFNHCTSEPDISKKNLDEVILSDTSSYFYVDAKNYPVKNKKLPIGIFDSGTGGLTVMDAIVNFDGFNNQNKDLNSDGILDFEKEYFIYLADQANMPYGSYPSLKKTDVLKEHILKDLQFLLSNKYYQSPTDKSLKQISCRLKQLLLHVILLRLTE